MASSLAVYRETKWVDGLKGIAALVVLNSHVVFSFARILLSPAMSETLPPVILQLPFMRSMFVGRPCIAIFAVLSGFVNALKPTKQVRAGQIDAALSGIAKSVLRRTGRFILPAMVVTVLSWLICQFGGYNLGLQVDSAWIRDTSPSSSTSFAGAFKDLYTSLLATWTDGGNVYDKIQWTLCYLLKGSMLIYLTLFGTAYMQPRWRTVAYTALYFYFWCLRDALIGINVYYGMILAELINDPDIHTLFSDWPFTFSIASCLSIFLGMIFVCYPEENPEWARWSTVLLHIAHYIFPAGGEEARFWPALGAQFIITGVFFNYTARRIMSHPALSWMGQVSFAVYLIHAPLIRTLLTWMLYGASSRMPGGVNGDGQQQPPGFYVPVNRWMAALLLPLFYFFVYRLARLWVLYVDRWCGQITNWAEDQIFVPAAKAEKTALPA